MPDSNDKVIIVLWGRHRVPKAAATNSLPANVDKGVRELCDRGYQVVSLYPMSMRRPFWRRLLGERGVYRTTTPAMAWTAIRTGGVIYTSSLEWARIVAWLKKWRILRNRLIVRWAGIDTDVSAIANGIRTGRADAEVLRQANVCLLASSVFLRKLTQAVPQLAHKLQFWPTGVDIKFYRQLNAPVDMVWDAAAVGSDSMRDWELPLALAERGLRVALVTEDPKVEQLLGKQPTGVRDNARLYFRVGFAQSASVMASARCILIATRPNARFSGSTTVGVAAALSKPIVLDDPEEAPGYGLVEGKHCEIFIRGDADSAHRAVKRIVDDPAHAAVLAENMSRLASALDLGEFTTALERCFDPNWIRVDFDASASTR